jgi:hypothetical protein
MTRYPPLPLDFVDITYVANEIDLDPRCVFIDAVEDNFFLRLPDSALHQERFLAEYIRARLTI